MKKNTLFGLIIGALVITLLSPSASAHRVHAKWEVGQVKVEAWYGGGDPMKNADVMVYAIEDGESELYENGKTDDEGIFVFTPKAGVENYQVVVESSGGHKDNFSLSLMGATEDTGGQLPLYTRIGAGIGYLLALAGAAMLYQGWKTKRNYET